jgi:hypothetical protein
VLSRDEILMYRDKNFEPTFPAKEKLLSYARALVGIEAAPALVNELERDCRLGNYSPERAEAALKKFAPSAAKPALRKFMSLSTAMRASCPCWVR